MMIKTANQIRATRGFANIGGDIMITNPGLKPGANIRRPYWAFDGPAFSKASAGHENKI